MNVLDAPLFRALGWTLMHFVWQGALVALLLAVVLAAMRRRNANERYLVCCAGLVVMMLAPFVTFAVVALTAFPGPGPAVASALADPAGISLFERLAPYLPGLTLCWIAGVAVSQARLGLHFWLAQHLKNRCTSPVPVAWEHVVGELRGRLGIRRSVGIVESSLARAPMVIGYLQPVILVPASAWLGLTTAQLRAIIAHELAHVRRHDYLVNLVQAVFESLFFYHPAVWWLSARLRIEREYCCDDVVIGIGGDRLCYAQALSSLEELRNVQPALASTGGSLMNRIRRLAGVPLASSRPAGGWFVSAALTLAVIAAGSTVSVAMAPQEREREHDRAHERHIRTEQAGLNRVNLVAILEEHDVDRAEIIRTLRETGMSNGQLLNVLEVLGTEGAIFEVIGREARRQAFIGRHIHAAQDRIHNALLEGEISEADAHRLLDFAEFEAHTRLELRLTEQEFGEKLEARMRGTRAEVEAALAAGRITTNKAEEMLQRARRNISHKIQEGMARRATEIATKEFYEAELHRAHDQIAEDVELGRIDIDEAKRRVDAVRDELHEWFEIHEFRARGRNVTKTEAKMDGIRREIMQAVEAGQMTEADAHRKLQAMEREFAEVHERHELGERERQAVRKRRPATPGAIAWASVAPALAKAAEAGDLPKEQLKRIHDDIVARIEERWSAPRGMDYMEAIVHDVIDRLAVSLREGGVPEADARKVLEAAHKNLVRHLTHLDWEREQDAKREIEERRKEKDEDG